jgi:hypothetical protein
MIQGQELGFSSLRVTAQNQEKHKERKTRAKNTDTHRKKAHEKTPKMAHECMYDTYMNASCLWNKKKVLNLIICHVDAVECD